MIPIPLGFWSCVPTVREFALLLNPISHVNVWECRKSRCIYQAWSSCNVMLMFKMRTVHPSVCQSNPGNIIISAQQTAQFHAKSKGTDTQKFPCPLLTHFACHLLCNHVQIQLCFHHLFLGACNHQNKKPGFGERKHMCAQCIHKYIHVLISKQLGKLQTIPFYLPALLPPS